MYKVKLLHNGAVIYETILADTAIQATCLVMSAYKDYGVKVRHVDTGKIR